MKPILSDTLPPPRMPTNGRGGFDSKRSRISSSLATSMPTTRGLPFMAAGTATIEASLRWQVPKASLT